MIESTAPPTVPPILVTVKRAADVLGLSPWTVGKLCRDGVIKSGFEGRRRLIPWSALQAYANNLPSEPPSAESA